MKTTLHLLVNARHQPVAKAAMNPDDEVILAGEALLIDPASFGEQRVFALQTDCDHWGLPLPAGTASLTDADWVTRTANADRVIVW